MVTQNGMTPLNRAAYNGHQGTVEVLLLKGANMEAMDNVGG